MPENFLYQLTFIRLTALPSFLTSDIDWWPGLSVLASYTHAKSHGNMVSLTLILCFLVGKRSFLELLNCYNTSMTCLLWFRFSVHRQSTAGCQFPLCVNSLHLGMPVTCTVKRCNKIGKYSQKTRQIAADLNATGESAWHTKISFKKSQPDLRGL